MQPMSDYAQLQLHFVDPGQRRYEVIRPIVLIGNRTAEERAKETQLHPETVRDLSRRFRKQGMLGLFPEQTQVVTPRRGKAVPEEVVAELTRLKALYDGFGYRELTRIIHHRFNYRINDKTVKKLWEQLPLLAQGELPLGGYWDYPDRHQARLQVIKLYSQGWNRVSISEFLRISRPTVNRWIRRFEADDLAGLADQSRAPKSTLRKVWLPLMIEVYHLQKQHPDAGQFRIWSLLAKPDISERTIGRIMALNRRVYDDIPHNQKRQSQKLSEPHPYKASYPHQHWFIDGRMMDFALDGIRWWSLIILDGYSRTMVAGAIAPTEASWAALMVLYTACVRYGVPEYLISDSGGAFTSHEFEAVCTRLGVDHQTIVSTEGESYMNLMETHFNIQRRLYDYQFSLSRNSAELEQRHQAFIETYNTTAHQGLLKEGFDPPIPSVVLADRKGRLYSQEGLAQRFSRALFPRMTNIHGCVTLHSYHFYVEQGLPKTKVLLWVYGEQLRAVFENVVLAEYHCRYDLREHKIKDIRDGVFHRTQFASPQGSLVPLMPQESLILYRPKAAMRQVRLPFPAEQLWLFELIQSA
jgi:transposase/transposase InsO family protein